MFPSNEVAQGILMAEDVGAKPATSGWRSVGLGTITLGLLAGGVKALLTGIASYSTPVAAVGSFAHAAGAATTGIASSTVGSFASAAGATTSGVATSTAIAGFTAVSIGWLAAGAAVLAAAAYVGYKTYHAYKNWQAEKQAVAEQRNADIERAGILAQQQQPQLTVTVEQAPQPLAAEQPQAPAQENAVDSKWRQRIQGEQAASVTQGNTRFT